ncbi:MAG: hypothetical protein R3F59_07885 [Myxococcota bacterium]
MTDAGIALAAGCVLQIAEATFAEHDGDLVESLHLEVAADPRCDWVTIELPRGSVVGARRVKQKLGDGSGKRLGDERWEALPRSIEGDGGLRLHVPELVSGDRVFVDLERVHTGAVTWRPGPARYVSAEVRGGLTLSGEGAEGARAWASDVDAGWAVQIGGIPPLEPLPARLAAAGVRVEERLTLHVPPGDPQIALYPGGGSSVTVQQFLTFPPADAPRAWPLDAPAGAAIALSAEPEGAASLEQEPGAARVVVPASEAGARVTVSWEAPDAPTHGERPPGVAELSVTAPDGEVLRDGDAWWLAGVHRRGVTPDPDLLVRALDRRFRQAAIPEPGAPMELRGRQPDWALAADLRPALLERVTVGDWPDDPLWCRKLVRARKTGALTPTEAAVTLWLYAVQLRLDATWALVRPAPDGPGSDAVPTGIGAALVRIGQGGDARWIDPACSVCGPFELPPELEGAVAWGPRVSHTPPPTEGRAEVRVADDTVTWTLQGPPALLLRRWLRDVPASERTSRLAARVGGAGARLVSAEGLDEAGAPVTVTASRAADAVLATPLDTPPPDPDGTAWLDWVGERRVVWAGEALPPGVLRGEALSWSRAVEGTDTVETLVVRDRRVGAEDLAALDAARAPAEAAPEPEEDAPQPDAQPDAPEPDAPEPDPAPE